MNTRTIGVAFAVLTLSVALASPAEAGIRLGQTFLPNFATCGGVPASETFTSASAHGLTHRAPHDGVLTSWSHRTISGADSTLTVRVFREAAAADQFLVVGDGGALQVVPGDGGVHTYATRIPVRAGDYVGYLATGGACVSTNGLPGDRLRARSGTATPVGGTATYVENAGGFLIDISAVLEPDVDRDGYGDETQDACLTSAALHTACPPPDTVLKKKPKPTRAAVTRFRFRSATPGVTFRCSVDDGVSRTCRSPATYRCLPPGKHTFTVAAVSSAGAVDPTPATVRFRVRGHRPAC